MDCINYHAMRDVADQINQANITRPDVDIHTVTVILDGATGGVSVTFIGLDQSMQNVVWHNGEVLT